MVMPALATKRVHLPVPSVVAVVVSLDEVSVVVPCVVVVDEPAFAVAPDFAGSVVLVAVAVTCCVWLACSWSALVTAWHPARAAPVCW